MPRRDRCRRGDRRHAADRGHRRRHGAARRDADGGRPDRRSRHSRGARLGSYLGALSTRSPPTPFFGPAASGRGIIVSETGERGAGLRDPGGASSASPRRRRSTSSRSSSTAPENSRVDVQSRPSDFHTSVADSTSRKTISALRNSASETRPRSAAAERHADESRDQRRRRTTAPTFQGQRPLPERGCRPRTGRRRGSRARPPGYRRRAAAAGRRTRRRAAEWSEPVAPVRMRRRARPGRPQRSTGRARRDRSGRAWLRHRARRGCRASPTSGPLDGEQDRGADHDADPAREVREREAAEEGRRLCSARGLPQVGRRRGAISSGTAARSSRPRPRIATAVVIWPMPTAPLTIPATRKAMPPRWRSRCPS